MTSSATPAALLQCKCTVGHNLCNFLGLSSAWDLVGLYNSAEYLPGEKKLKSFVEEIKRKLYFFIFL